MQGSIAFWNSGTVGTSMLTCLPQVGALPGASRVSWAHRVSGGDKDKKKEKSKDDGPAYWPLIRQVRVKCNARALSTGAILVDLPGVADANAARNNIAKDYMKKCDCVWILAPITRAVDDKTARGEFLQRSLC